ncbi:MAG: glycosyltransferase [Microthrixaceae bacterium]|nr:glycosyltransferase [Microthrixaceae bacterium]
MYTQGTPAPRVLAIIVAYNSPEAIARCLASLDQQTRTVDGVLVIDNSDRLPVDVADSTLVIVDRTQIVRAGSNMGPAGGFALGLATFQENPAYTHAWLMDDDCYPDANSLELLMDVADTSRPGTALFPSAVYEATGVAMNFPGWSGVLIDRVAVRLAGLPRPEMFWWAEDTEYLQHRLPHKGVQVTYVAESRVLYDLIRRVGGRPAWKYYYEVRNMIWHRIYVQRGSEIWKLPRTLVLLFGSAIISADRGEKVRMYFKGVWHGLLGRLGSQVKPPSLATTSENDDA